ncbi:FCD domain-containing protein [Aeromonas veronii]|uniref:FCD domain-containing protein n=1 Tax=Aeromonas veronii TaxID=654 RepID=UPI00214D8517|nr:FCD domain-containing protein [Aeromonas veronii]MCR3973614.1 FCD domain-containing protein [Aeromonas veronii]MCR3977825.1 FCD domain-containing protein [Aeromonas veronii]
MNFDVHHIQPLKKQKLSDHVCEELERLIANGSLQEGDYFPSERELMEMFQVGRPSVREALQKLQQKGLAEINSGEKAKVSTPGIHTFTGHLSGIALSLLSQDDERQQFERIRQLFEIAIVREAAINISDAEIKQLHIILEKTKAEINDPVLFAKNDVNFHSAIIDCLKAPIISSMYESFINWLIKARSKLSSSELREQSYEHHYRIVNALAQHNPDLAESEMRAHLSYVDAQVKRLNI